MSDLLNIENNTILLDAVRDYFRAAEDLSWWLEEDFLFVGDLSRYEQPIREEWELFFKQKKDELGEDAAEDERIRDAKAIYIWVENNSHQILSHPQKIGWHIEFKNRLRVLLEGPEGERVKKTKGGER